MSKVLATLSERFETARKALNDVSDRLFTLNEPPPGLDQVLKTLSE